MTTSNITGTIDLAFVDRADIKQYIGPPGPEACYGKIAIYSRDTVCNFINQSKLLWSWTFIGAARFLGVRTAL